MTTTTTEPQDTAPENLARLLHVLRVLLDFGRHFLATLERRASYPGFHLFEALFGTPDLPAMLAHLHRGVLRAAALEALLRDRAATGRDIAAPAAGTANPIQDRKEAYHIQIARLVMQRARHDALADPNHLATPEDIEAEISALPVGQTIDAIRRDLGIIAIISTEAFWAALTTAIAGYQRHGVAELFEATPSPPEASARHGGEQPPRQCAEPRTEQRSEPRSEQHSDPRPVQQPRESHQEQQRPGFQPEQRPEPRPLAGIPEPEFGQTENQPDNQPGTRPRPVDAVSEQMARPAIPSPCSAPAFKINRRALARPRRDAARPSPRGNVTTQHQRAANAPTATGPPPRAAPKRAA